MGKTELFCGLSVNVLPDTQYVYFSAVGEFGSRGAVLSVVSAVLVVP